MSDDAEVAAFHPPMVSVHLQPFLVTDHDGTMLILAPDFDTALRLYRRVIDVVDAEPSVSSIRLLEVEDIVAYEDDVITNQETFG